MGRRMFDGGERPWGEEPPFRNPVFVVTHRERETLERLGGTSFTLRHRRPRVRDRQAKAAAGDKDVAIAGGGTMIKHALELGLLDELELHHVPVILGDGQRLLDVNIGAREGIELVPERVIHTPKVTRIRYRAKAAPRSSSTPAAASTRASEKATSPGAFRLKGQAPLGSRAAGDGVSSGAR